jgi:transcriptional regulator with XRE-family HTH domain
VPERVVAAQKDGRIKLHDILTRLLTEGGFSGTRKQVCAAVGISPSALSQMARGQTRPSLETLVRLADFFRVSLDYLVLGEQPVPPASATDYGPLARYIDLSLARLQAQSDERVDLVARIGRALAEQIERVAGEVASASPSLAGLLRDEETMLLEAYSVQTWIFSMNLHYDIILTPGRPPADETPGRLTRRRPAGGYRRGAG